jgi:glycosyltransferase involved in cell wall biosynthesis
VTATPRLSVVVPTGDRPVALARCLAALGLQTAHGLEVVVVDDASKDAAAVAAIVAAAGARLVCAAGRGPAAARNAGARAARAPVVCFTDDDCAPAPAWAAALVERIAEGADAAAGPTRNAASHSPAAPRRRPSPTTSPKRASTRAPAGSLSRRRATWPAVPRCC